MDEVLREVFGGDGVIVQPFSCMDVAEEELAKIPKKLGDRLFLAMCPSPMLRGKTLDLYRAHVRELISRGKKGHLLGPATAAELCCVMMETSLRAPLTSAATAVYEELFERCLPGKLAWPRTREIWVGQVFEEICRLERKYAVDRDYKATP